MRRLALLLAFVSPLAAPFAVAAEPAPAAPVVPEDASGEEGPATPAGVYASPEALAAAVKAAFEARDVAAWKANVVLSGLSPDDDTRLEQTLRKIFSVKPLVRSIAVDTLPDGFDRVLVGGGRKYTLTLAPAGVINLRFGAGKSDTEVSLPYGKVGDGFKLGTLRSEKLAWKGPEDRLFVVAVNHTGEADEVASRIRYNASGVTLEKRVTGRTPRVVLPAQYIESVEVERAGEKGETSLTITFERKGEPVTLHTSEKLTAPGRIIFERQLDMPAEPAPATPAGAPAPAPGAESAPTPAPAPAVAP